MLRIGQKPLSARQERRARERAERKEAERFRPADLGEGFTLSWTLSIDAKGNTNVSPGKNLPPLVGRDFFCFMYAIKGALNAITGEYARQNNMPVMTTELFALTLGFAQALKTIMRDHITDEKSPLTDIWNKIQSPIIQKPEGGKIWLPKS